MANKDGYILSEAEYRDFQAMRKRLKSSTPNSATPSTQSYTAQPNQVMVKVRITSTIDGQGGKYNGKLIKWGVNTDTPGSGSGPIQYTDVGIASDKEDCIVWNLSEMKSSNHAIDSTDDSAAFHIGYIGSYDDATKKPIIFISGASGGDDELEGLVSASTLRSGQLAAWFYTVVEGVYTPDGSMIPLAGGRTITGVINRCEVTNDSSGEGELSQGVTVDDISDTPLKPIRNGCGVLCRLGQLCSGAGTGSGSGSGIPSGSQWAFSEGNEPTTCTT